MKKLEPLIGKPDHSGGWLVEPSARGVLLQRIIDREKLKMGQILVKVRDDLEGLDIVMDYPRVMTTSGPLPDTTRPMVASGGYHVGYANWVTALEETGKWRLELDCKHTKAGRKLECTRYIDVEVGKVMCFEFEDAFILLAKHGCIFEEVDQVVAPPVAAPPPEPEIKEDPKPSFSKRGRKKKGE
jgi:hypothetical protein